MHGEKSGHLKTARARCVFPSLTTLQHPFRCPRDFCFEVSLTFIAFMSRPQQQERMGEGKRIQGDCPQKIGPFQVIDCVHSNLKHSQQTTHGLGQCSNQMASAAANSDLSLPFLRPGFDYWAPHHEPTHGHERIPTQCTTSEQPLGNNQEKTYDHAEFSLQNIWKWSKTQASALQADWWMQGPEDRPRNPIVTMATDPTGMSDLLLIAK
ncbi:uncharacterized protein [Sinocyclocheilus grahami]|uniref:uncharacterized protein n=1 Tax=Sinocyclocheilus grahami TaxID=75366 RepID=UPI0007ACE385|nr:PREDICTED: uncharacterized protein LOC107564694 [Sinocyclocheilus grahami]